MKNLGLFGNEISLNGIRMILRSGIHQPNCFLGTTPSTQNYSRTSSPIRTSGLISWSTTSSATNFKIDHHHFRYTADMCRLFSIITSRSARRFPNLSRCLKVGSVASRFLRASRYLGRSWSCRRMMICCSMRW